jgi:hypothetical protein
MFGVLTTFVSLFVVITVWCACLGTLRGSDPGRLYFLNDFTNLINYSALCPLYVGLACALITTVIRGWSSLADLAGPSHRINRPALPIGLAISGAVLLAALLTSNYIAECLNPRVFARTSWYVTAVVPAHRIIGALGVYYAISNFSLLVIVLLAAFAFISVFTMSICAGRKLYAWNPEEPLSFDDLTTRLTCFTKAYLIAKLLAAVLMLNAFTLKWEHPTHSWSFWAFGAAMTFFGIVFVSLPRYYIELQWFRLQVRIAQASGKPEVPQNGDIRSFSTQMVVHFLDLFIIGGFVTSFWLK